MLEPEKSKSEKALTNRERRLNLMRGSEFFASFTDEEIETVMERGKFRLFAPFKQVVRQDAQGESFFVILEGRANVMRLGEKGKMQMVTSIMEGCCFGEMAMLLNLPRTATVMTELESQILEVNIDQIEGLGTEIRDKLYYMFAVTLAGRLKEMISWQPDDPRLQL